MRICKKKKKQEARNITMINNDIVSPPHSSTKRKASILACVLSLVSTMIGGGVLSLPFAFSKLGIIFGISLLFLSAIASDYSVCLLIFTSRQAGIIQLFLILISII